MAITKKEFEATVKEFALYPKDYAFDVLIRLAHHSTAIEGNTLTLSDTITILLDEMMPGKNKSMRELYEVANHREAFADLLELVQSDAALTSSFVKRLQADLMSHLREDKGAYKTSQNAIIGSTEKLASPSETPFLMEQWIENYNWQLNNLKDENLIEAIAQKHIEFESIHPFSDGNGRTGRLLMSYGTMKTFGVPVVISNDNRNAYIESLQEKDIVALSQLLIDCVSLENERLSEFQNMEIGEVKVSQESLGL